MQAREERVVLAISVLLSATTVDFEADLLNSDDLYSRTTAGGLLECSTDGSNYTTDLGGGPTLCICSGVSIDSDLDTTIYVNGLTD